jgi:hypothetical protein
MRKFCVAAIAAVLAVTAGSAWAQDPDSASAAAGPSSARAPAMLSPAGKAAGTCKAGDLAGNWGVAIDHDLGSPGVRALLSFCQIQLKSNGTITTVACTRQSSSELGDTFSGKLKIASNCVVDTKGTTLTYHDEGLGSDFFVLLTAMMSGDKSRITGVIVGTNSKTARGTFEAIREP